MDASEQLARKIEPFLQEFHHRLIVRPVSQVEDLAILDVLNAADLERFSKISNPGRKLEWLEGRRALREIRTASTLTSLSHSSGHIAAIAVEPSRPGCPKAVGIDLEPRSRSISPKVLERLSFPEEAEFPLSGVDRWVLKEAAFKGFSGALEGPGVDGPPGVVSQYRIVSFDERSGQGTVEGVLTPQLRGVFQLAKTEQWVLAVVLCLSV